MPSSLDRGCASEWHAPRPFWKATAPIIAAFIIPPRASRSLPFATAASRCLVTRSTPASAIASAIGWSPIAR